MKFRPCIDIHNGKVKQIVGGSIADKGDYAAENFVSDMTAGDYARLYQERGIYGGHVILLNSHDSEFYQADIEQAKLALTQFPGGLQIGGGITAENAPEFIAMGASHVIVTSYIFENGEISMNRLKQLVNAVGEKHIVLDLSCRKRDDSYYIVTNRWQTFTSQKVEPHLFHMLGKYCDEFLIHAVDVEGKKTGLDLTLVDILAEYEGNAVTYAGGISSFDDLEKLRKHGKNRINFTIGSALDLFGGELSFEEVVTKF